MNIYELTCMFWRVAEAHPFTPSECAMYFFLLHRANQQHWRMPVACPTTTVCLMPGMTKQNVVKVRLSLARRGMIAVTEGGGRSSPPSYTLLLPPDNGQQKGQPNGQPMGQLQLSDELTLYKDINNKDNINNNNARESEMRSVNELKALRSEDTAWQRSVVAALACDGIRTADDLAPYLNRFFLCLEARGIKKREEEDCKAYFFNWLNQQATHGKIANTNDNGNREQRPRTEALLQRRGFAVGTATAESYEGRF